MGSKTLLYGVIFRVIALGMYAYMFHTIPTFESGLIGMILGFAGGVYLDRSRSERSVGDNLAAGLVLSALLRLADVYYGITQLTPLNYRRGLIGLSLAAMLSALSSEVSRGVPAKIPILGLLAIILAFVLVFSAVTTKPVETIERYSGGSTTGGSSKRFNFQAAVNYIFPNGTSKLDRPAVPNATSYTMVFSYTDSAGTSADHVRYFYVPIRTNRSVTVDGDDFRPQPGQIITVKFVFSQNVSQPAFGRIYVMPDGSLVVDDRVTSANADNVSNTFMFEFEVSNTIQLAVALYVTVDRTPLGTDYYAPAPITTSISRSIVKEKSVQSAYLLGAILSLAIATIDALPLDTPTTRRRRTTRRKRTRSTRRRR